MPDTPKTISDQQFAANRANAAKSTGPKTPEGKARSSQNAVKHGFTAAAFAVVRLEGLQEVANLKADIVSVYQPVNSQELVALERMALAQQAMFRANRLEAGLFTTCMNETMDSQNRPFTPMSQELAGNGDFKIACAQNRNYCLADGFQHQIRKSNVWSLFLRYQAQAERQYRRALEEFLRLKALRMELPNEPIAVQPEETPELYFVPDPHQPFIGPFDKETAEENDAAHAASGHAPPPAATPTPNPTAPAAAPPAAAEDGATHIAATHAPSPGATPTPIPAAPAAAPPAAAEDGTTHTAATHAPPPAATPTPNPAAPAAAPLTTTEDDVSHIAATHASPPDATPTPNPTAPAAAPPAAAEDGTTYTAATHAPPPGATPTPNPAAPAAAPPAAAEDDAAPIAATHAPSPDASPTPSPTAPATDLTEAA